MDFEKILFEDKYKDIYEAISECQYTSQMEAILYMLNGENVLLSGPAGSGKSFVIQKFCEIRDKLGIKGNVARTSTTGISAINIDGITIHRWSGMGADNFKYEQAKENNQIKARWKIADDYIKDTSILVIDEISMLSERSFEYVIERIKKVKGLKNIQIIVSGDFTQLPPVNTSKLPEDVDCSNFCYNTKSWKECNFKSLYLDKLYRTSDMEFSQILHEISIGNGESQRNKLLKCNFTNEPFKNGSMLLLTTNANVDKINNERQALNPNKSYTFETRYGEKALPYALASKKDIDYAEKYKIQKSLTFKVGDTIMVTNNNNDTFPISRDILMNGSIGTFIYDEYEEQAGIRYNNVDYYFNGMPTTEISTVKWVENKETKEKKQEKEVLSKFSQYPFRLAYAMTVHKSQGQTFSNVTVDLSKCWQRGLGYVALSRASSLKGITILEKEDSYFLSRYALEVNPKSIEIKKDLMREALELRKNTDFEELIDNIKRKIDEISTITEEDIDFLIEEKRYFDDGIKDFEYGIHDKQKRKLYIKGLERFRSYSEEKYDKVMKDFKTFCILRLKETLKFNGIENKTYAITDFFESEYIKNKLLGIRPQNNLLNIIENKKDVDISIKTDLNNISLKSEEVLKTKDFSEEESILSDKELVLSDEELDWLIKLEEENSEEYDNILEELKEMAEEESENLLEMLPFYSDLVRYQGLYNEIGCDFTKIFKKYEKQIKKDYEKEKKKFDKEKIKQCFIKISEEFLEKEEN